MNWFIRFGEWLEKRRDNSPSKRLDRLEQAKQADRVFVEIQKDLAIINARLNKIELYIGLQRDPKPSHVEGSAKIS